MIIIIEGCKKKFSRWTIKDKSWQIHQDYLLTNKGKGVNIMQHVRDPRGLFILRLKNDNIFFLSAVT